MPKLTRIYSSALFIPTNNSAVPITVTAKTNYKEAKIIDEYSPFRGQHPKREKSFEIDLTKIKKK